VKKLVHYLSMFKIFSYKFNVFKVIFNRHYAAIFDDTIDASDAPQVSVSANANSKAVEIVSGYLSETRISLDACPLKYWRENENQKPQLAKVSLYCVLLYFF